MPKCINDDKKKYSGKELSPKGIGYSADAETTGLIMKGNDGNIWIVTETKRYKRWKKLIEFNIDFENLPKLLYTESYLPVTTEIKYEEENGLEEKFGGSKPFFIKGEEWPLDGADIPMKFFCQFKDPRENNNFLYRVFLPIDNENDLLLEDYHIDKIELNEENIKNQIFIEKQNIDEYEENEISDEDKFFKPFIINSWLTNKELKSLKYIMNYFNIREDSDEYSNKYFNMYYDSKFCPNASIKIGGTPVFTQKFTDIDKYNQLLQITESKELPFSWRDCGIAHISDKLNLYWDCF